MIIFDTDCFGYAAVAGAGAGTAGAADAAAVGAAGAAGAMDNDSSSDCEESSGKTPSYRVC
jgi:hypothetical protein